MDVVLVGLPGSGKTVVGRALAERRAAELIDLDAEIERDAGRSIPEIFAAEGEPGFRARERRAVEALGPADRDPRVRRVIAPGGGSVVDPRNRWRLYRDRRAFWIDAPPEVLAARLARSPTVRPLVASAEDPLAALGALRDARRRFYAAASRVDGSGSAGRALGALEAALARPPREGTRLVDAETPIGRLTLGTGNAVGDLHDTLERLGAGRAVLVSEPGAWRAAGEAIAAGLRERGWAVEVVLLPRGEPAKRLSVVERAARTLAGLRVERREPLVAIGGGALGDTAGFVAATYLRGVPLVQVPTTLGAQIDSAIGGKTAVDLPEGKNLVGAFHQPAAIVIDVSVLATLPIRQRRAALGEAVKMAVLGDPRLLELLESDGPAIARGTAAAFESGAVAELVERAAWAKVEVVAADEREAAGRINLNLGHSIGHGLETAAGYRGLLHGEAVAYGLRGACRLGVAMGVTPAERAERVDRLLTRLELASRPLPYPATAVLEGMATDKKHSGGRLRWVLPTASAVEVRRDVPDDLVREVVERVLAGRGDGPVPSALP
jgi:shikimate kinase/3-dehydroquinate synthase